MSADRVAVIECEIDDQTGEDLAQAIDRLRAFEGVLDVIQAPVFGKKGRMMVHLRILARPDNLDEIADIVFTETSTIGLRHVIAERLTLPRTSERLESDGLSVGVKTVMRPGGTTLKVDADDLADIAGKAARDTIRAKAMLDRKSDKT